MILTKNTELLTKGSHYEIEAACDICGKIKKMEYRTYYKMTNCLTEKYHCRNCSSIKTKKTNLQRYGCETPLQNKDVLNKMISTNLEKYGVEHSSQLDENKLKQKNIKIELKSSNNIDENNTQLKETNIEKHETSELETIFYDFIKDNYSDDIITCDSNIISPYELKIYLPKLKLAFEFNGVYYHNELYKNKNYHLNKTEECEKQGIQLIQIYEDTWIYRQDIVKSMILNKLKKTENKIFARKTQVKEISDNNLVRVFLDKNHVQGFVGSKIKLGLFYNDELVSLMTLGNRRIAMGKKTTNEGEYELLRYCNKLNTNVIGGASKLFKYFVEKYNSSEITTYADRSISQGKLYETLGFQYQGKTEPNYYYVIDGIRHHRFNFRKDILIKNGYDANKTEHQIMLDRKIYRIFDSGNFKYKFNH